MSPITPANGKRCRLSKFVDAPHTTALRWIGYLEGEGFIEKVPHPNDRRTVFVRLLDRARDRLDQWLEMVAEPFADTSSLPGSL